MQKLKQPAPLKRVGTQEWLIPVIEPFRFLKDQHKDGFSYPLLAKAVSSS